MGGGGEGRGGGSGEEWEGRGGEEVVVRRGGERSLQAPGVSVADTPSTTAPARTF